MTEQSSSPFPTEPANGKTRKILVRIAFILAALAIIIPPGLYFYAHSPGLNLFSSRGNSMPGRVEGKGGYLDEIIFSVIPSGQAVSQLKAGTIDVYFEGLASPELSSIQKAGLKYATSNGLYYALLFNPSSCANGSLNPFHERKIREAVNYILDRNYINEEFYAGGSLPKWLPIVTQMPDYADLADVARTLETKYSYDLEKGSRIIADEMIALGATLGEDGKWQVHGAPVKIIFLVRTDGDGTRKLLGDYVTAQLGKAGFLIDEQYKNASEASPLWIDSAPTDCQWNIYTAGWGAGILSRDERTIFQEMYLPASGQGISAWMANEPNPEFQKVSDDLYNSNYSTLPERHELMTKALQLALEDSFQVWLIDSKNYSPYRANVEVTSDLAAGIENSAIWPYTMRFTGVTGGTMKVGVSDLYTEPWNPIAGSNMAWDSSVQGATWSGGLIADPYTGLVWPLKAEKAAITAQAGLPVGKTLDWVTLDFAPSINVPPDAYVGWDAGSQTFITVGTKFPQGLTAKIKSVVYYPEDLFQTTTWHDGSALTMADFILPMIMLFDRADKASAIYDEQAASFFEFFMQVFKGFRITDEKPLTIEFYTDNFYQDAELNAAALWAYYGLGEAPWEVIALTNMAEADGKLAYSTYKATTQSIEQTSLIGGPSLDILAGYLDTAIANKTIPYAATLGKYITPKQAAARYTNLKNWYNAHHHFLVGTGPYYIDQAYITEKTITLKNNGRYLEPSDKWSTFGEARIPSAAVTGPTSIQAGDPAKFSIAVTYNGEPYAEVNIKSVRYLVFDASNEVIAAGEAELISEGDYEVNLDTANFPTGASKFEAIVLSNAVAVPAFAEANFVITP